jgi:hypothetical protein
MREAANFYRRVIDEIEAWVPSQDYGHESKFQNELKDFLDERLNDSDTGAMGRNREIPIYREHGHVNADLAVDGVIGVEMKRNLDNSQAKKLRGQIESYLEHYNFVIIVACGIQDTSHWRDLKNKYESQRRSSDGYVKFIWKKRDKFGTDPNDSQTQEQIQSDANDTEPWLIESPAVGVDVVDPDEYFQDPDDHNPFL